MKKYSIFFLLLSSCFINSEGRIVFYDFTETKYNVEKVLVDSFGNEKDSSCITCSNRIVISPTDGTENIFVHFKDMPKEEYLLGFTCDSLDWKENPNSRLGLIGVNYGNGWKFRRDLSSKEQSRIQIRLEKEILSKIKFPYQKSDETGTCKGM
jgi:hypothetical protein